MIDKDEAQKAAELIQITGASAVLHLFLQNCRSFLFVRLQSGSLHQEALQKVANMNIDAIFSLWPCDVFGTAARCILMCGSLL